MTRFGSLLFNAGFAIGAMHYEDHYLGDDRQNRMVLSIAPERRAFADVDMIVDSGAPWCLINPEFYDAWGLEFEKDYEPAHAMWIRGMRWLGHLTRTNLILKADDGESLIVAATFFIPAIQSFEIWNYPNFLGLDGFLNRIRYAVDPAENVFYFGPL